MADLPDSTYRNILDHVSDGVYVLDSRRNIVQWNRGAERLTGYTAADVVGHCCAENILVHVDETGRCLCTNSCPVAATLADGKDRQADVFVHHRDGHRIPVRVNVSAVRDTSGKITSAVETFRENSEIVGLRGSVEKLKQWAQIDLETGTAGRRVVESALQARLEEMKRFGWTFGIFLAEIDFHDNLEQDLSPEHARRVRRMVGKTMQNSLRSFDVLGRWDNSHFLGVVANVTLDELQTVCMRSRVLVEASFLHTDKGPYHATVSIGATACYEGDNTETMLRRAQVCLFESRKLGRNRVTLHTETA